MLFTMEKTLALSSMEDARLIVKGEHFTNNLTGVNIIENFADMGDKKGCVALVLDSNVSYLRDCIARVKHSGFYGIIAKEPSEDMIMICEEQDMTLIGIPQSTHFHRIAQQIIDSILKMYSDRAELMYKAYDEFCNADGEDDSKGETTVDAIASMLGTRIITYYENGRIGSAGGCQLSGNRVIELGDEKDGRRAIVVGNEVMNGYILPFKVIGKTLGRLFIQVEEERELDEYEMSAIRILMLSVTLKSTKSMAVDEIELRLRNDLVSDLLSGSYSSERSAVLRAKDIGWNIEKPFIVATIHVEAAVKCINKAIKINRALREGLTNIMDEMLGKGESRIIGVTGDVVNVLWPYDTEKSYTANAELIRQAFEKLFEDNKEYLDLSSYTGGIGGKTNGAGDIRKSYNDATNAMKFGVMTGGNNKTYDMNGLGLYKFISRIGSREEMESFIPQNLRRLIEYDSASKNVLVNTLDVFLQCDCNITKAAQELDIHYKSLVYRISRIKEIMELDTLDGDIRLEIQLAFKILHILNSMNQ